MKWIDVKDKLPAHHQYVLTCAPKDQAVCVYVDIKEMNKNLKLHGFPIEKTDPLRPGNFCSQEVMGNVLNAITHWMPLPEKPECLK